MYTSRVSVFLTIAMGVGLCSGPAWAQDCNDLLNPNQVLNLYITMDPAQWEELRFSCPDGVCPEEHVYYQANLQCETGDPILVGIRRKNDLAEPSEADPQKVSLKIDINEFVPGQTFAGKAKLSPLHSGSTNSLTHVARRNSPPFLANLRKR